MPLTTPDNIYYTDAASVESRAAESAAQATSVQDALDNLRIEMGETVGGRVMRSPVGIVLTNGQWRIFDDPTWWYEDYPVNANIGYFNGTWVAPVTGLYHIYAGLKLDTTTNMILAVKRNNTSVDGTGVIVSSSVVGVSSWTSASVSTMYRLVQGDVLRVAVFQFGQLTANVAQEPNSGFFGLELIRELT